MKNLDVSWDGIHDATGYLFSLAKSLSCTVKNSPWHAYAEDIVATSGFAFRMWVSADLCPSATSIWGFDGQKPWVESGGLSCEYAGRYWGQDHIEKEKRLEAIGNIKRSVDRGVPAISWDIGIPEWGLVTGYDNETETLATLSAAPPFERGTLPYEKLGMRELPLLSVLTITGENGKPQDEIFRDTCKMAVVHLDGGEWCDNAKGLEAYPALIRHFNELYNDEAAWNREYLLGNYGALKYYAWRYFEKNGHANHGNFAKISSDLAALYKEIFDAWVQAFKWNESGSATEKEISDKLTAAWDCERRAADIMRMV